MIKCKCLVFTYKGNQSLPFYLIYILTRNPKCCKNRDDLLHLSFTRKFQYFWRPIHNAVKHL